MRYRPPLNIEFLNHAYIRVTCDDNGFLKSLADYFTFDVPNAKFMPQYRKGGWDGKVRLFDWRKKILYAGLLPTTLVKAANSFLPNLTFLLKYRTFLPIYFLLVFTCVITYTNPNELGGKSEMSFMVLPL